MNWHCSFLHWVYLCVCIYQLIGEKGSFIPFHILLKAKFAIGVERKADIEKVKQ
jgi:hypothetical protein